MAVTVPQVRTQISDAPQMWPSAPEPPELLGTADGVQTTYALRYGNVTTNSLTIYAATPPASGSGSAPTWTAIVSTNYAMEGNLVMFATPPTAGQLLGARYQVTAFCDTDLAGYLSRAQALYSDDLSVLKRVQYDIIDVVLMDYNRMILLAQGEFRTDPAVYAESLKQLKAELRQDLAGGPVPGAAIPAMFFGGQITRRYQPLR